jgi:hypothetical protein
MTPVRRRLAALAMVLLVPVAGGCGISGFAGAEYQTDEVYQPGVGVNDRSGKVAVLGAVVVSSEDGEGTFVASLVNEDSKKSDRLTMVTGDGIEGKVLSPVEIGPDSLLNLADTGAISVTGEEIKAGAFVRLELTFESGQTNSLNVPVVADDAEFSDITPARPSASPSASPSESPSDSATP